MYLNQARNKLIQLLHTAEILRFIITAGFIVEQISCPLCLSILSNFLATLPLTEGLWALYHLINIIKH